MIREFGDDAYWKAVQSAVIAVQFMDNEGAEHFAAVAKELARRGYHKRRKDVRRWGLLQFAAGS